MKKLIVFYLLSIPYCFNSQDSSFVAYKDKNISHTFTYKKLILPVSLIAAGSVLKIPSLEDNVQGNVRSLFGYNFKTKIDDFTQYTPLLFLLSGQFLGFKALHGSRQMITNVLISSLITGSITYISKESFGSLRPDKSAYNSYPSGHSALAFNLATIQFLEYKDNNIIYASSGYLFAIMTALMRVGNNRHWSGDILTGAGLGIGVAIIVNYWNPLSGFDFIKISNHQVKLAGYPFMDKDICGIGLILTLNTKVK
jgi:membrane-associated phospholipid phosphatase